MRVYWYIEIGGVTRGGQTPDYPQGEECLISLKAMYSVTTNDNVTSRKANRSNPSTQDVIIIMLPQGLVVPGTTCTAKIRGSMAESRLRRSFPSMQPGNNSSAFPGNYTSKFMVILHLSYSFHDAIAPGPPTLSHGIDIYSGQECEGRLCDIEVNSAYKESWASTWFPIVSVVTSKTISPLILSSWLNLKNYRASWSP